MFSNNNLSLDRKKGLKIQENKEIETQIKQAKLLTDQAFDIVECDEMWSFIQNKKQKCWIWLGICRFTKLILGFALGGRGSKTAKDFWNVISPHCQDTTKYRQLGSLQKDNSSRKTLHRQR